MTSRRLFLAGVAAVLALAGLSAGLSRAADPDALWKIVHGKCVPDEQDAHNPSPCAQVDLSLGDAVLKDNSPSKPTHFLLIPTTRITGIESPLLLTSDAVNYFAAAWDSRHFVADIVEHPLRRDQIALAVNSISGRSQDQLHIHIDCVRPDVRAVLSQYQSSMTTNWTVLPIPLQGHRYRVMRISGADLDAVQPFKLVADFVPGARAQMGTETIVVVGAVFADGSPGFYLLNDAANPGAGDLGSGEELLESCGHDG